MTLATGYACRIELDSICEQTKCRLTTFVVSYPRFVHAEMMTHRMFSRNSASSRAIPTHKMIDVISHHPARPSKFLEVAKGMQPTDTLTDNIKRYAMLEWEQARDYAIRQAELLASYGIAKEQVNRLLEPFLWHTTIITATDFQNFFKLRCHPDAQQEIQVIARMMRSAYEKSEPHVRQQGEWHCPFVDQDEIKEAQNNFGNNFIHSDFLKFSVARCARVSYTNHEGREDRLADVILFDRLKESGHWSPFEHVACASFSGFQRYGNFTGWQQYRKMFDNECTKG